MNKVAFSLHFAEHLGVGCIFIILSLVIYIFLMRKYIFSLFDPLLFYTVLSAMAGSVVFYLYWFDLISSYYLFSYLVTQIAFYCGFFLVKPPAPAKVIQVSNQRLYAGPIKFLYPISVVIFILLQLLVYSVSGIPIFLESRLEAFSTGTGYGFLSRIIFVCSQVALVISFYKLLILKRGVVSRSFDYLVVAFCILVAGLSGSKGALLTLIFTVSVALFFARRFYQVQSIEKKMRGFFILLILLSFPVAIAAVYLQSGIDQLDEILLAIFMRFVQTGDVFFMLYPNDVLAHLDNRDGLLALFYSPLGTLRLIDREHLPVNLGLQAFWYHYDIDLLSGPNARHNVFGLHYFGFAPAILFSIFLGWLFSLARNFLYRFLPANPSGMVTYVLIANCAIFIEQDVSGQAIDYLLSVLLIFPVLYVLAASFDLRRGIFGNTTKTVLPKPQITT